MRFLLVGLAVLALGFSHGAFAQAPKEVIVLDGQIAVNNGPVNPASVMVENGVTNPVPIIDVTPDSNPLADRGQGGRLGTQTTNNAIVAQIPAFPGKLFKIKTVHFELKNMHRNVLVKCQYQGLRTVGNVPDVAVTRFAIETRVFREATTLPDGTPHDAASAEGSYEFVDAPWDEGGKVSCEVKREDLSPHQSPYRMDVFWTNVTRDPPAP